MTADVVLRFPEWDLNKSRYDETDSLPLMATPGPVLMILALYLLYVLKVGPALMTNRDPFKLTSALLLYNGLQVAASVYLFYTIGCALVNATTTASQIARMMSRRVRGKAYLKTGRPEVLVFSTLPALVPITMYFYHLITHGVLPKTCCMNDSKERKEMLFGMWLYFIAKISELLDTVFFVLRKKDNQITFLHLYHHSIAMVASWAFLKYWPSETLVFLGFFNSLVHVFMYTYYGLSALGPKVAKYIFWKKYMTKFQLIQFVCIIIHYTIAVRTSECPPSKGEAIIIASNCGFFLILFLNFYIKNYIKKSSDNRDKRIKTGKVE